jgi:hypothetical protein
LTLGAEEIEGYLESLERESKALKDEALRFTWWMRGGLSYEEAIMLSQQERELVNEIIKENLEATKKSGLPFF